LYRWARKKARPVGKGDRPKRDPKPLTAPFREKTKKRKPQPLHGGGFLEGGGSGRSQRRKKDLPPFDETGKKKRKKKKMKEKVSVLPGPLFSWGAHLTVKKQKKKKERSLRLVTWLEGGGKGAVSVRDPPHLCMPKGKPRNVARKETNPGPRKKKWGGLHPGPWVAQKLVPGGGGRSRKLPVRKRVDRQKKKKKQLNSGPLMGEKAVSGREKKYLHGRKKTRKGKGRCLLEAGKGKPTYEGKGGKTTGGGKGLKGPEAPTTKRREAAGPEKKGAVAVPGGKGRDKEVPKRKGAWGVTAGGGCVGGFWKGENRRRSGREAPSRRGKVHTQKKKEIKTW